MTVRWVQSSEDAAAVGRREQRKATTRAELLAAGRKLFSEKGLYEARVEDLTATAGIAKGTLYQYFVDKDELVVAVVTQGFRDLDACVARHVEGSRGLVERAGRIAEAHAEFFADNPDLMRVFHQVRGLLKFNARRWSRLQRLLVRHIDYLADQLGRPPTVGSLSAARRSELALALFGTVSGMASVRAALDASPAAGLRPAVARRAGVALARAWVERAATNQEPRLNARVARQRGGRDRRPGRGNDAKTPDGGTG
jgi:AcrR family transcriptional regulator